MMRDETGPEPEVVDSEDAEPDADAEGVTTDVADEPQGCVGDEADEALEPSAARGHPMRTLLKQFSEQFTHDVQPLIEPIRQVADTLAEASPGLAVQAVLPDLRDLLHHVRVLTEKVAEQQAYVLIFGPLKSGKSTFMNAICSAYVSEVTSLPAYPCIVNVTHDTTPSFTVTRYDGHSETYTAQQSVYDVIQQAHSDLMASIRRVEDEGEDFDPAVHMPQAIRKIDVHLPTGDLADSGAVLVDTPGLYSRMKFGYDRLTRDFRNAAACAIFIVKTDNLFLEQVFAEFHELLDLFSRVFLIVNLDTTKKDLDPTGQLVPSLEHDDPGRIIDAFTDLSMSAPLKAAADAGRVRIYPVDLLGAASTRILGPQGAGPDAERAHGQDNFDALLTDLTDYLNSSEYLRAFLNDSLRRARSLLDELGHVTRHETVSRLADDVEALGRAREETIAQCQAVQRLKGIDWTDQSEALLRFLGARSKEQSAEVRQITGNALRGVIDAWFETDASLAALRNTEIEPLLNACRKQYIHYLRGEMAQQMPGMQGAIAITDDVLADASLVGIDLGEMARSATDRATPAATLVPVKAGLGAEQIPVRRGIWDWLLLRSKASVRRRLFGPAANPDKHIAPAAKTKRIGEIGRAAMQEATSGQFALLLEDTTSRLPRELVTSYVANLTAPMTQAIEAKDTETADRLTDIEARLAEAEKILAEIASLGGRIEVIGAAVGVLAETFAGEGADPDQADDDQTQTPDDTDEADDEQMQTPDDTAETDEADEADGQAEPPESGWSDAMVGQSPPPAIDPEDDAPDADDQAPAAREADEFDGLYAPYVAEASALPDQAGGQTPAEEDDVAPAGQEPPPDAEDTDPAPQAEVVDDDDDPTPEAEVVDEPLPDAPADETDAPADEADEYPPVDDEELHPGF